MGIEFPYRYDRRHEDGLEVLWQYQILIITRNTSVSTGIWIAFLEPDWTSLGIEAYVSLIPIWYNLVSRACSTHENQLDLMLSLDMPNNQNGARLHGCFVPKYSHSGGPSLKAINSTWPLRLPATAIPISHDTIAPPRIRQIQTNTLPNMLRQIIRRVYVPAILWTHRCPLAHG